jgi:hypothetical protein
MLASGAYGGFVVVVFSFPLLRPWAHRLDRDRSAVVLLKTEMPFPFEPHDEKKKVKEANINIAVAVAHGHSVTRPGGGHTLNCNDSTVTALDQ